VKGDDNADASDDDHDNDGSSHLAVVAAAVVWRHSAQAAKQPKRVTEHENGDAGFQAGGEPVGRCPALLGGAAAITAVENSRN
jgi:hypothetical protein